MSALDVVRRAPLARRQPRSKPGDARGRRRYRGAMHDTNQSDGMSGSDGMSEHDEHTGHDGDIDDILEKIGDAAVRGGVRIAIAESLTCGRLASTIGATEEASDWFAGGVVAYQMQTKHDVLGIPSSLDPCSAECAEGLASGVRTLLGADVAVAATGVGGPDPEDGHPPGTVYIGWSTRDGQGHRLLELEGDPDDVLDGTVDGAIRLLATVLSAA